MLNGREKKLQQLVSGGIMVDTGQTKEMVATTTDR